MYSIIQIKLGILKFNLFLTEHKDRIDQFKNLQTLHCNFLNLINYDQDIDQANNQAKYNDRLKLLLRLKELHCNQAFSGDINTLFARKEFKFYYRGIEFENLISLNKLNQIVQEKGNKNTQIEHLI